MLRSFKNIIFFFCCCITVISFGQASGTKIFSVGSEYQEPPHINTLYQLSDGYILLGTTKGLFKFDGINFDEFEKNKDVPDTVTAICELKNKQILFGFSNGSIGELKNNQVTLYRFEEGFPKVPITKIISDNNNIVWIATA